MVPGSPFIKSNVADVREIKYKVQTGTKSQIKVRWKGIIPIFRRVTQPVYSYYTAYEDMLKIDPNLPVGYIVGLKSSVLEMGDDPETVRKALNITAAVMDVARGFHIGKSALIFGLFTGSIEHARAAGKAARFCRNFDGEFDDLKGSRENDGLVAKESQYYPKTFTNPTTNRVKVNHKRVLGNPEKGYVEMKKYNHKTIIQNDAQETWDAINSMRLEMGFK
jgi:hypothetical protein